MNTNKYEHTAGAPLPELEPGSFFHAYEDNIFFLKVASNGRADDWVTAAGIPASVPVHLMAGRVTQFGGKDDARVGRRVFLAAELQLGDRLNREYGGAVVTQIVVEAGETTKLRVYWADTDDAFSPGHHFDVTRTATAPEFGAGYPDAETQLAIAAHPRATAEQLAVLVTGEIAGVAGLLVAQHPNAGSPTLAELLRRSSYAGTWEAIAKHPNVSEDTLDAIRTGVPGKWDHLTRKMVLDAASR